MNALLAITKELQGIGYPEGTLLRDYTFADVLSIGVETRTVALAAFTQTPPSYRTAAFAVVVAPQGRPQAALTNYKALGAPVIFALSGSSIELWQVLAEGEPRKLTTTSAAELPALFERHAEHWNPQAIHRAKAIEGEPLHGVQLDFIDAGLMTAIEGEIHTKLDSLLKRTLSGILDFRGQPTVNARVLFHATFRFLAAKVLTDRGHEWAQTWANGDVQAVLNGIDRFYDLGEFSATPRDLEKLESVWSGIRDGINFRNISADDLAFVYENTFVTSEARAALGTHSTPRQMAEHVVRRLELWRNPQKYRVYEPFTGAGVLLVAALRQLRAALPLDWTDAQKHTFLTERLSGDEIDEFACEVAKLSLILADYPNHNGWDVRQADLFVGTRIADRVTSNTFVICNPPFEDFKPHERHTDLARHDVSKPVAVLHEVLNAKPAGIGFVLPSSFGEKRYRSIRQRLEKMYGTIEIVDVPDDVFSASRTAATLLIARDLRTADDEPKLQLRSSEIKLRDRLPFLRAGVITRSRSVTRLVDEVPSGNLWVPALHEVWDYLSSRPKLRSKLELHRGLEWTIDQADAVSTERRPSFRRGLHSAVGYVQYSTPRSVWLDCKPEHSRGGALKLRWTDEKLILNAARISRSAWRLAASLDQSGLVASQQFFGAWPNEGVSHEELLCLLAVINGPVANAFATVFTTDQRFRVSTLNDVPLPNRWPKSLASMVRNYLKALGGQELLFTQADLAGALTAIDATLVESYELPTRLERELLRYFEASRRPLEHEWNGWADLENSPGLRLTEILQGERRRAAGNWVTDVFAPLPEAEADALRAFLN